MFSKSYFNECCTNKSNTKFLICDCNKDCTFFMTLAFAFIQLMMVNINILGNVNKLGRNALLSHKFLAESQRHEKKSYLHNF